MRKVIIWGYKLGKTRHTNSYVFHGYYKGFKRLGYETLWLDDEDDISGVNFDNCIFLSEGQVDSRIPLDKSSIYVIHNPNDLRYEGFRKINLQVFHKRIESDLIPGTHPSFTTKNPLTKVNQYTYVREDAIYQPWATDLLPEEINLDDAHNELENRECVWVGSYGDRETEYQNTIDLDLFFNECKKHNISVKIINPWVNPVSMEENRKLINKSFLAPAIQGPWQIKFGYAPQCRILKNISYGHFGITNHEFLNELFDNRLVCDPDPVVLAQKAIEKKFDKNLLNEIKFLMNEVKTKHTYVDRIKVIESVIGES